MTMFHELLYMLSVYSVLFPFLLGLIFFKKIDINSKLLLFLVACASIAQIALSVLPKKQIPAFYNVYIIIDATFWMIIFMKNIQTFWSRKLISLLFLAQVVVFIYYMFCKEVGKRFFNELVCLASLLQVVWILLYFYERYSKEENAALEKKPMFWFCMGLLLYVPCTYFLFAFYPIIRGPYASHYASLWTLHDILNSCMYLIFSIGICVNFKSVSKLL